MLIYVGESGCVRKRIRDIDSTYNHTLRHTIGVAMFASLPEYQPATSKRKFPVLIESLLDEYLSNLDISFVPIDFGRTETEELKPLCSGKKNNITGRSNRTEYLWWFWFKLTSFFPVVNFGLVVLLDT